jgi:hypothetical protein
MSDTLSGGLCPGIETPLRQFRKRIGKRLVILCVTDTSELWVMQNFLHPAIKPKDTSQ